MEEVISDPVPIGWPSLNFFVVRLSIRRLPSRSACVSMVCMVPVCSMVPFAQHALAAVELCGRRSGACNQWRRRVGKGGNVVPLRLRVSTMHELELWEIWHRIDETSPLLHNLDLLKQASPHTSNC